MKSFVKELILYVEILVGVLLTCVLVVFLMPSPYEKQSYGVFCKQIDYLDKIVGNKYIYVSGSSGMFGINAGTFEKLTGNKMVNLGNYAGYENDFVLEIALESATAGDVILLSYENTRWFCEPESGDLTALFNVIDINHNLYKYLSKKYKIQILQFLPTLLAKKADELFWGDYKSKNVVDMYDECGNLFSAGYESTISGEHPTEYGFGIDSLNQNTLDYVKDIVHEAVGKDVKVLIVAPPVYVDATEKVETIDTTLEYVADYTGAEYISNAYNHLFPYDYMADSIWHCNEYGREENTEALAREIESWLSKN